MLAASWTTVGALLLVALSGSEPVARRAVELFFNEQFAEFRELGNERLKAGMTEALGQQAVKQVRFQLGAFKEVTSASEQGAGFLVRAAFQRGSGTFRVAFDPDGRIAGFTVAKLDVDSTSTDFERPAYAQPDRYRESSIELTPTETKRGSLPGTLTVPVGRGPFPAVVLVHGSGPNDQDETLGPNKPFRDLAWGLASRGIAVLRYNKRTKEHPTAMAPAEITLAYEVTDDVQLATKLLRTRSEIDPKRIFVLGHSLGAMAAPTIARDDANTAGIIVMAGPARPLIDLIEEQIAYIGSIDPAQAATPQYQAQMALIRKSAAAIREGRGDTLTEAILGMPPAYIVRFSKVDAPKIAATLSKPILVIHGGRDYQVTMKDYERWRKVLGRRSNVTWLLFEDLNHLMIKGSGPSTPTEYMTAGHVDERIIQAVAEWVEQN